MGGAIAKTRRIRDITAVQGGVNRGNRFFGLCPKKVCSLSLSVGPIRPKVNSPKRILSVIINRIPTTSLPLGNQGINDPIGVIDL
jgi:hypothetical protein